MKNRFLTGCLVISIAFLLPCGLLAGTAFLGLAASGFTPPEDIEADMRWYPSPLQVGRSAQIEIRVTNRSDEYQSLSSVDVANALQGAFEVQQSLPPYLDQLSYGDFQSYVYESVIAPGETMLITFVVVGNQAAAHAGWIDVCINTPYSCARFQTTFVVAGDQSPATVRDAQFYNDRGLGYRRAGAYALAAEDFRTAIELDPDYATAYNNLAWTLAYDLDMDHDEALNLAKQAVALKGNANNHDTLALVYFKLGEYELALEHYNVALSKDSAHTSSFRGRAEVHLALEDKDAALADYRKYLALDPSSPDREEIEALMEELTE